MNPLRRSGALILFLIAAAILAGGASDDVEAAEQTTADYHYIVLEMVEDGFVEPVFHRRVRLDHPRRLVTEDQTRKAVAAGRRDGEILVVRVLHDREVVYRDTVPVIRDLRGEFHGAQTGKGFEIDHSRHTLNQPAVVVRVPAVPDSTLEIEGEHRSVFLLDALEADRKALPLAALDPDSSGAASKGRNEISLRTKANGSPSNRVDILIMGDGYTSSEVNHFNTDAGNLEDTFFSVTPYSEYANYVNITTLFTASQESGADHPPYDGTCESEDRSCCADTEARSDSLAETYVDTAFDGRFCAYNIHRLLVVDNLKILAAAAAAPAWDSIFVLVNDTTYGGSGGGISVASTNFNAPYVVRHEFGHSFTQLADEYDTAYPDFPDCSDVTGPPCEANVTDATTRAQIKWEPWIDASTPVPTPEGSGHSSEVGLFEGARYLTRDMYRPKEGCAMHSLTRGFCEICSQAYVLKLYDGEWGVPYSGIDMIEPGSESPANATIQSSGSVTFSVELLEPVGGPPAGIVWTVDGVVQDGQTGPSFTFNPPGQGTFDVVITATDETALVHPAMAGTSLSSSRRWTVQTQNRPNQIRRGGRSSRRIPGER